VWLEIPFFNRRAACRGEICFTMPRAMTSSAISRPVHWLMGRSLGWSQANASIRQICSALISEGRPGRGISLSRSATERSVKATDWKASQRLRQARTVSGVRSNCRAIWLLFWPASASKMMRARSAICWAVLWRRARRCSSLRSLSLTLNRSGFGPLISGSAFLSLIEPSILQTYFGLNVLVVSALALAKQRGILLAGWGGLQQSDLPDTVMMVESIPHSWLFPQMAAIVHHGGAGTTAASLRAGVPSLLIPFGMDQQFWAQRVVDLGVGPGPIPRGRLIAADLAQAILSAMDDQDMRSRAAKLGELIQAEDGISQAVEAFQRYYRLDINH
jgi:hypothetical protein